MDGTVPDAKTIWLFRERLARAGAVKRLFARFDLHLEEKGLMASGGQIIDASIIPVPRQRNDRAENDAIKAGKTPEEWQKEPAKLRQKDVNARWTMKNGQSFYGYKNHVNTDRRHKLIRRYRVTDACVHDGQAFDEVFDTRNTAKDIWADGAYRSKEREEELKARGYRSHIHHKGARGHPLSDAKRAVNTRRSTVRARVERSHGRELSSRADINPLDVKYILGNLSLINVACEPLQFTHRIHASDLSQRTDTKMTNKSTDDLPGAYSLSAPGGPGNLRRAYRASNPQKNSYAIPCRASSTGWRANAPCASLLPQASIGAEATCPAARCPGP
jgi:IS5 family transposase